MIGKVIAVILVTVMFIWCISNVVSICKSVKKKLRKRRSASADAQNTNTEKECDQSDASDMQK